MFYIITYASHSERYFELLKQSCPDIIVLEKENNKINATVNFCKSKNPDDIVCFVDGYKSVVLSLKEEILEKYKSFNTPLVFSQGFRPSTFFTKYLQDKLYGLCKYKRLNSGLYIGTAESIIDFWKDIKEKEDDKSYATLTCRKINYMKIDDEYKLFYDYSSLDKIDIKNNSLFINDNKIPTSVISCPSNNSINHILSQLNYTNLNLPDIKYDYVRYIKYFIKEYILVLLIIVVFIYFKNIFFSIIISFLLFFSLLKYELYLKHTSISTTNKILSLFVDVIHISFEIFVLWLLINFECNINKILLLNIIYFSMVAGFFIFKRCILTIITNKLTDTPDRTWGGNIYIFKYIFDINTPFEKKHNVDITDSERWIQFNTKVIFPVILLNLYCLWKINKSTLCISKQ
uniref:PLOD1-3-like GT domain-containing protein n=1 Tax=viral metagenome TaxID=1070528 RepID=A0A6C0JNW7_9ZZZZ